MWNRPPPPGFQGLREDLPLLQYERNLPHWRQDGATYYVTFRLGDSLPQSKLIELDAVRTEWLRQNPPPRSRKVLEQLAQEVFLRIERWLDAGYGACLLRDPDAASLVVDAMHYFDGSRYELGCFVVMANHVHVIVRPLEPKLHSLESILKSWKSYSGRRVNVIFGRSEVVWQQESYDRIIRDEEHLWRVIQYIGRNPARAGLQSDACPLWIRPEWKALGWIFEPR